jgi:hypothetical protein
MEIHTAKTLISESSPFEIEIAIAKLKSYKLPSIHQSSARETLRCEIHKLVNSFRNKEELLYQLKECIIVPIYIKV